MDLVDFILRDKRDKQQEYTIHLFEFCNLSCPFCWQDHDNIVGIDTVLDKLESIEKFFEKEMRKRVVLNIMGGEIFADEIFDEKLKNDYIALAQGITDLGKKYKFESIGINWVTNLVISKRDYVRDILKACRDMGCNSKLVTSYDPRGRFNKPNLEIFKENVYDFWDDLEGIGVLLTKSNIKYWLTDPKDFMHELYHKGVKVYADYYMPDCQAERSMPTDKEHYDIFTHFIDNYPKIDPIRSWIENERNVVSCRSSKLVLEDGTMCLCGNLVQEPRDKAMYKTDIQKANNKPIEKAFLEKYNCSTCEYFHRCTLGCFMAHDYKYAEEIFDECVYKMTHRYIENQGLR